jgi:hypothetical protein
MNSKGSGVMSGTNTSGKGVFIRKVRVDYTALHKCNMSASIRLAMNK